jgi:DNA-binding beta-propeller fold protein YncE
MIRSLALFAALSVAAPAIAAPARAPEPHVSDRIPGADGGWDYASVDAASHRLFVSRSDGVMVVDLATGKVTPQFVPGARVHAAFVIPGSHIGVSTNGTPNTATLFDARTGAVTATIKVGAKPDAATYDAGSRTVWVMNADDGTATIIDPRAAKAIGTVTIGGSLEFAVVDGKGHLFVNVEDKAEIAMVDIKARKVIRRTALPGCEEPTGLALTGSGVLIAACANGVAKTVEAASGRVLADIAIGPHPDAVIWDATRNRAYIPSGGDGTLTVIDAANALPHAVAKGVTQAGARTGAVDSATGKVYLPVARFDRSGAGRPKAVPGSFEVLVVSE